MNRRIFRIDLFPPQRQQLATPRGRLEDQFFCAPLLISTDEQHSEAERRHLTLGKTNQARDPHREERRRASL